MTLKNKHEAVLRDYSEHKKEREASGIPPLPLDPNQTTVICELLRSPPPDKESFLLHLFKNRIPPGVYSSAKLKANFLGSILHDEVQSPLINKKDAIHILASMLGGYNIKYLIEALQNSELAAYAVKALSHTILVYDDAFNDIVNLSQSHKAAKKVIESWADAEWFKSKPGPQNQIKVKIFKVDGEINTDDLSPAGEAWSRTDIPLHALSMGESRFPGGIKTIAEWRHKGHTVAFVGDVVGTGSSRKSATNSLLWHIGEDIPSVPNKRTGGIVIGGVIAPIFFNTVQDSGGLPLIADVTKLENGASVTIDTKKGEIRGESGDILAEFTIIPRTLSDDFQAGGRILKIIGRSLTKKARKVLGVKTSKIFLTADNPVPEKDQNYSLAQKIVGKACGLTGVLPGTYCEPKMTTVLSQDTTGPMTADELKELACMRFQAPLFMQSFCHTAAYPKITDTAMHKTLPSFITERKGVALKPGDGVCHSWMNRMLVPDTLGTGGDSHTRFPLGLSFPAGSGLVAFAGALGFMPLDMPESVLVRFKGKRMPGITLRDVVNAIPYTAIKQGLLTVPKKNKKNVYNGRIIEMEGLDGITVEQAFELTDATAERSAAGGCIKLTEDQITDFLKSNMVLLQKMIEDGYQDQDTLRQRIDAIEKWLKNPELLTADKNAEYAAEIEIDLSEIKEPIVACPNDPDNVKLLSEVKGTSINDVFIGSCMTNIGHYRTAAKIWESEKVNTNTRTYICPPTRMDQSKLKDEGVFAKFNKINARIEIPGCSLCMGNQLRVPDNSTVFSTSTRNFDNRMGTGAQVYLGSAELAAVVSIIGSLPEPKEYFKIYKEKILPFENEIYSYLEFDKISGFDEVYKWREV
ncbi:MAG: bifunctional aconitate hydratase 2/2-methylisocitrate dehydratase [bacterium]